MLVDTLVTGHENTYFSYRTPLGDRSCTNLHGWYSIAAIPQSYHHVEEIDSCTVENQNVGGDAMRLGSPVTPEFKAHTAGTNDTEYPTCTLYHTLYSL